MRGEYAAFCSFTPLENRVRILIIRFSSIGDIVLTTPVVRCLKQQLTGEVELHYLTKAAYAPLLRNNPYIDHVHTIEHKVEEVIGELRRLEFDYVIDLHKNLRSLRVKSRLKRLAFTFNKHNVEKWLLVNTGINLLPDVHLVDRYFQAVKALGVENDGEGLDYFIDPGSEVPLTSLPESFRKGYVLFAIGGKYAGKKLPVEKIINICKGIDLPILLAGGSEDEKAGEQIAAAVGQRAYNSCGRYSLDQSASLVKQARLVITHDTGLMHIAAAFKKQIISIWGATVPAFGMYPYLPGEQSVMIQASHLRYRPTSKLGNKNSKRERRTMEEISEAEVINAARDILAINPAAASA